MAYKYLINAVSGASVGYVRFNTSVASGSLIGPGTSITITGEAFAKNVAVKSIVLQLQVNYHVDGDTRVDYVGCVAYVNKSISKGKTGTFSLTWKVSGHLWQYIQGLVEDGGGTSDDVEIHLRGTLNTTACDASSIVYDIQEEQYPSNAVELRTNSSLEYSMYVITPSAPYPSGSIIDRTPGNANSHLGGYAIGHSVLDFKGTFTLDYEHYPDQTLTYRLELTGAMTATLTGETEKGASEVVLELPALTQAGTVNWRFYVFDQFHTMSAYLSSGTFSVRNYSRPVISAFTLERYAEVIDSGGASHVAADDGELVWLSVEASVTHAGFNAWTASFTAWPEGADEPETIQGAAIVRGTDGHLTGLDDWNLSGFAWNPLSLLRDEAQLAGFAPSAGVNWIARFTITDSLGNSATVTSADLAAADTIFDVEPYGIGVGMRSQGQKNDIDPITGDVAEIHQSVDIAEDWKVRIRGPIEVAAGQLMQAVAVSVPVSAASGVRSASVTVAAADLAGALPAGFAPMGVVGVLAHSDYWYPYRYYINADGELVLALARYTGTVSSATTLNNTVYVLCLRTLTEDEQIPVMDDTVIVAHTLILGDTVDAEVNGTTLAIDDGRFNVSGSTLNIV